MQFLKGYLLVYKLEEVVVVRHDFHPDNLRVLLGINFEL